MEGNRSRRTYLSFEIAEIKGFLAGYGACSRPRKNQSSMPRRSPPMMKKSPMLKIAQRVSKRSQRNSRCLPVPRTQRDLAFMCPKNGILPLLARVTNAFIHIPRRIGVLVHQLIFWGGLRMDWISMPEITTQNRMQAHKDGNTCHKIRKNHTKKSIRHPLAYCCQTIVSHSLAERPRFLPSRMKASSSSRYFLPGGGVLFGASYPWARSHFRMCVSSGIIS